MSKFVGKIGLSIPQKTAPGVISNVLQERTVIGDVTQDIHRYSFGDKMVNDTTMNNKLSIIGDKDMFDNAQFIVYVYDGVARWKVTSYDTTSPPRIYIYYGAVYNG